MIYASKGKLKERVEMGKENQNDIQKEAQKNYTLVPNHLKDKKSTIYKGVASIEMLI
jgi:hypothetical protein